MGKKNDGQTNETPLGEGPTTGDLPLAGASTEFADHDIDPVRNPITEQQVLDGGTLNAPVPPPAKDAPPPETGAKYVIAYNRVGDFERGRVVKAEDFHKDADVARLLADGAIEVHKD